MTDETSFKITIKCPQSQSPTNETRGSIAIDNKIVQQFTLTGAEEKTYEFAHDLDDGDHTLTVNHDYSGDAISALVIEKIEMEEIDLGVLAYNGVYTPTYPEPWYSDECAAGRPPKETIGDGKDGSSCLFMGWEGRYDLKFSTPLYEWLLESI